LVFIPYVERMHGRKSLKLRKIIKNSNIKFQDRFKRGDILVTTQKYWLVEKLVSCHHERFLHIRNT